jgi:hypothetical protein
MKTREGSTAARPLRNIPVPDVPPGSLNLSLLRTELQDYLDVLLGREMPPINTGVSTLAEVASVYLGRAREIEMLIYQGEMSGLYTKGGSHYKYRTGELRSFIDLVRNAYEMGSRRITVAQQEDRGN